MFTKSKEHNNETKNKNTIANMGNRPSIENDSNPNAGASLPKTMKAAVATGIGDVDDHIFLRDDLEVPTLASKGRKQQKSLPTC